MKRLLVLLLFVTTAARAATFVLAPDDETIRAARAVVVATAGASHARWSPTGAIETVTTMTVDESIRGPLAVRETFGVVEPGGYLDGVGLAVAGSPRFTSGERVLLLLETSSRGEWTARNYVAGVFRFARDVRGRELLIRDEHDLCGVDAMGRPHREPRRLAREFLSYVREVVRGGAPRADYVIEESPRARVIRTDAAIGTYLIQHAGSVGSLGIRWNTFPTPVVFRSNGTQPGAVEGGLRAANRGIAAWTNDPNSNVVYQYGGTTNRGSGFVSSDSVNSIQFNDPAGEIEGAYSPSGGSTLAIGGAWFSGSAAGTHNFGGERFYTIREADLVVQNGITGPGLTGNGFDHVVSHELGHTLGFRHSDEPPDGGTSTDFALMNSTIAFNQDATGAALQSWDREAVAAVYGAGPACTPPAITQQPQGQSLITPAPRTLNVVATGDQPLTYQWYEGPRGSTISPIAGANSASISVNPSTTTSYWVRVSNGCDPPADSEVAIVTIAGCPAIAFTSQSGGGTILQGRSITLTAQASGGTLSYQWYEGSLATNAPIGGATGTSVLVTPSRTTTYFARATNTCGSTAVSAIMTVVVIPCDVPRILIQPVGGSVAAGESATLYAEITGTEPVALQWFEGQLRDTSRPLSNAQTESIRTDPLFASTSFWVRATNECGSADSVVAPITVVQSCIAPAIPSQPHHVSVSPGSTAFLTVNATGTSLTYRWYQGAVFDFTRPLGGNGPTLLTPAITATTQFWVRIENSCGSANSAAIEVEAATGGRRRAVRR